MKKGWESKKVVENMYGTKFTRWYIKSPNGNFYELYKSDIFCCKNIIFLKQDMQDHHKDPEVRSFLSKEELESLDYNISWNRAMQEVYKIEESGKYSKALSDAIENCRECKILYKY